MHEKEVGYGYSDLEAFGWTERSWAIGPIFEMGSLDHIYLNFLPPITVRFLWPLIVIIPIRCSQLDSGQIFHRLYVTLTFRQRRYENWRNSYLIYSCAFIHMASFRKA